MHGVRGAEKQPGEVRRSQNWIGGTGPATRRTCRRRRTRFGDVLGGFEKYLHAEDTLPPLVRAGLLHVQFETIHPYLDGNGRLGRLLVDAAARALEAPLAPLLYLSLFFKRHREDYYRRLNAVRRRRLGGLDRVLPRGRGKIAEEAARPRVTCSRSSQGPRASAGRERSVVVAVVFWSFCRVTRW